MEDTNLPDGNQRSVYIVYNDTRKDFSSAEKYGKLREVFSSGVRGRKDTKNLIKHARNVLSQFKQGDYLLMVGDPMLCAIAVAVAAEYEAEVGLVRWNSLDFEYYTTTLDFYDEEQPQ